MEPPHRRSRAAITAVFAANGALFASLYSRLPTLQAELGLSEGELGLALLAAPIGLIAAQVAGGGVAARLGSRPVTVAAGLATACVMVLPTLAGDLGALAGALLLVGAANGALDVSMNAQGIAVERVRGTVLFTSLHAAFSFGALGGAGLGALAAGLGAAPELHLALASVVGVAVVLAARSALLGPGTTPGRARRCWRAPPGRWPAWVRWPSACCWPRARCSTPSAVYLAGTLAAGPAVAAAGLAVFQGAMGTGRLAGDRLAQRFGPGVLAGAGAVLAAAGLAAVAVAPTPGVALAGLAVGGLGLASVFPLALRTAAARAPARRGGRRAGRRLDDGLPGLHGRPAAHRWTGRAGRAAHGARRGRRPVRGRRRAVAGHGEAAVRWSDERPGNPAMRRPPWP
jgi:predicted MFS family arabinose efflux permease